MKFYLLQENFTGLLQLKVSPNPGRGGFTYHFISPGNTDVLLTLTDISGQLILEKMIAPADGENTGILKIATPGIYILKLTNRQGNACIKIVAE